LMSGAEPGNDRCPGCCCFTAGHSRRRAANRIVVPPIFRPTGT
jgi:hypothetical protein